MHYNQERLSPTLNEEQNNLMSPDSDNKRHLLLVDEAETEKRVPESLDKKKNRVVQRILTIAKRYGVILPLLFYGAEKSEPRIYEEQAHRIEREIGYDIVGIGERTGYQVKVVIPSADGKYIINIGQMHASDDDNINSEHADEILDSQKRIELLINDIEQSNPHSKIQVYAEAVTNDDYQTKLDQYRVNLESIQPATGCFIKLATLYRETVGQLPKGPGQNFLRQMFAKRYEEISHEVKKSPFNGWLDEINRAKSISPEVFWGFSENQVYIHAGAINKLAFEGRIALHAAETVEQNTTAMQTLDQIDEILEDLERGRISENEAKEKITTAHERIKMEVDTKRESIAIEKSAGDSLNTEPARLLIYGNQHDFSHAVENYNQTHHEGVGLISLKTH